MTDTVRVMKIPPIEITLPAWVESQVDWQQTYGNAEAQMQLAVTLARENVLRDLGGPFGAAIFDPAGKVVSVGVNRVFPLHNSVLHAEMVAFMLAQKRVGSFSLSGPDLPVHTLVTSCEPCAMCLGATLWSGVRHVISGATREDAIDLGFEEGPVFPESYRYLQDRGITFAHGVLRAEARAVLDLYLEKGGPIYNGEGES